MNYCRRRAIYANENNKKSFNAPIAAEVPAILITQEMKSSPSIPLNDNKCPKCGKEVKRGMYMHAKYCKGN